MIQLKYTKNQKQDIMHQKIEKFVQKFAYNFVSKYTLGIREKRDLINGHIFTMLAFNKEELVKLPLPEERGFRKIKILFLQKGDISKVSPKV